MTIHKRKEIEVKVKLGTDFKSLENNRLAVKRLGFSYKVTQLETDYLPDTPDDLCKRNGLLLRFRKVETRKSTEWLLTLKKRITNDGVMDFDEIETEFTNPDIETFEHINELLLIATGHSLDETVLDRTTLDKVRDIVRGCGFTKDRILLDKYREEYSKSKDRIMLDFFPDDMGAYMEIESHSKSKLEAIVTQMNIPSEVIITTDYGDLLKEHKHNLPSAEQRVALFSDGLRIKMLER